MVNLLKKLTWLGHDGYCLSTGRKIIYIDPFKISADLAPADLVLITHEHYDHCSVEDIKKISKKDTVFVTEKDSAAKLSGDIRIMQPGESIDIDGIIIEAVPAYNTNKKFHPKSNGWLGFIVTIDGERLYHAGDTDYIPEMEKICADIALLPVSGTYVMTAKEAARAALDIKPKIAIPMHYDSIVGTENDADEFARALEGKIKVEILQ